MKTSWPGRIIGHSAGSGSLTLTIRSACDQTSAAVSTIAAQIALALYYGPTPVTDAMQRCELLLAESEADRSLEAAITALTRLGYRFIGPDSGWLACRNVGAGRLSDPQAIVNELTKMLTVPSAMPKPSSGRAATSPSSAAAAQAT
mgnify:CR=1 FL=1